MSDFVVSVNDKKYSTKILSENSIVVNGKVYSILMSKVNDYVYLIKNGNKIYDVTVTPQGEDKNNFLINGNYFETVIKTLLKEKTEEYFKKKIKEKHQSILKAPMPGLILKYFVEIGDSVKIGENLLVLEAMKMENIIKSPSNGTIVEVLKKENSSVDKDGIILIIE